MFVAEADMASSVDLGENLEGFVSRMVKSGRDNSRSEILREGVRLIHERETRLAALDASILRGISDAEAGVAVAGDRRRVHAGQLCRDAGGGRCGAVPTGST